MRVVLQRVSQASVTVEGRVTGAIGRGLLVFAAQPPTTPPRTVTGSARKIVQLRVFEDDEGVMNRSVVDVAGDLLAVSQFTLYASTRKGNRHRGRARRRPTSRGRCSTRSSPRSRASSAPGPDRRVRRRHAGRAGQRRAGDDRHRQPLARVRPEAAPLYWRLPDVPPPPSPLARRRRRARRRRAGGVRLRALQGRAVDVVPATTTRLQQSVVVSGRVLAPAKVEIGATITGRIASVAVDDGDRVAAGQVVVVLESDELTAALAQAQSSVRAAEAESASGGALGRPTRASSSRRPRRTRALPRANTRARAPCSRRVHRPGAAGRVAALAFRRAVAARRRPLDRRGEPGRRRGAPDPRGPARDRARRARRRGRQARADADRRAGGRRRARAVGGARRHRAARPHRDDARPRRRDAARRADRREEPRGAEARPGGARFRRRLPRHALRRGARHALARHRRPARHRRGEIPRPRAPPFPALRHDGVDRHRVADKESALVVPAAALREASSRSRRCSCCATASLRARG